MSERIYFIGIGGTAMGNVAILLKQQGYAVLGSDEGVYPPMSDLLEEAGVEIYPCFSADNLEKARPDFVVVGNAVSRGNVEVECLLRERRWPYGSLPALLRDKVLADRRNVVVCGTHGKTTTTSITAWVLQALQQSPGYLIGGAPLNFDCGTHWGQPDGPFVIEGDEYDSAFFDKRSKFVHYLPRVLVFNNLEFDHADIFRDVEDIQRSFEHVTRLVPPDGVLVVNGDDERLRALYPLDWAPSITVGVGEDNEVRIEGFQENRQGSSFALRWADRVLGPFTWELKGEFNARNAAMALVAALQVSGLPREALPADVLSGFKGVKRRQQLWLDRANLKVVEDFGHHPTAVAGTLQSLRNQYPGHRVVACVEPRSNTSVQSVLQSAWRDALVWADEVHIGKVYRMERLPVEKRLDVPALLESVQALGRAAFAHAENSDLLAALALDENASVVVFFSNGSFDGIVQKFVALQGDPVCTE